MRATSIPGPVRVAVAVDGGIVAVYGISAVVGVPDGRLGNLFVGGQAAVWAAVVLAWVFPTFWARWSAAVERLFLLDDVDGASSRGDHDVAPVALAPWPSLRSQVLGATALSVLIVVQALTSSGAGVAFRTVVAAYMVAAGVGAALLAIAADVSSVLAATRAED